MSDGPRRRFLYLALILTIFLGVDSGLSPTASKALSAASAGVQNVGFETGTLYPWETSPGSADVVQVVDIEGPDKFSTYVDMGNIKVNPFRGANMLRLGTPRRVQQSQERGDTTVRNSFTADRDTLSFAVRVFSWDGRGNDYVVLGLTRGSTPVGQLANAVTAGNNTCQAGTQVSSCQLAISFGSNFLATDWIPVKVSGLTPGDQLTLSYTLRTTANNSQSTWLYFDANTPPIAKFSLGPSEPSEGDVIRFIDRSFDPDPGDRIVSWNWDINGKTLKSQNPRFVFADDGLYTAKLTVTDQAPYEESTSVTSGGTARDGTTVPALNVHNAVPRVKALDVEVLPGSTAKLFGRFVDPGWKDTISATFTVNGVSFPGALQGTEHKPAFATGIVTGTYEVPATAMPGSEMSGDLKVTDNEGGAPFSSPFKLRVVAPNSSDRDAAPGNGTIQNASPVAGEAIYLSYIQARGDVDVFKLPSVLPNGAPIPAGGQVRVELKDLPFDYDLVLLSELDPSMATPPASGNLNNIFQGSTSVSTTGLDAPLAADVDFSDVDFSDVDFSDVDFSDVDFSDVDFSDVDFSDVDFSDVDFSPLPLSLFSSVVPTAKNTGAADINLDELGLGSIGSGNLRVVGYSANRGLSEEVVWTRPAFAGTKLYAVVIASNGGYSLNPYKLQVETSLPVDPQRLYPKGECVGTPLVSAHAGQSVLYDAGPSRQTIIVTQRERIKALYGEGAWGSLEADLKLLAQNASVKGTVVSLDSSMYNAWDVNKCSVDAANAVSRSIRDVIKSYASAPYIVLVGNDYVVPQFRVPVETVIGNESLYLLDSGLKPGTPLFWSLRNGQTLTDDYYATTTPRSWQGRELYIPDRSLGRLVETPNEISGAIRAYLSSAGMLNPDTALVTGYDFFADGAHGETLQIQPPLTATELLTPATNWTATDLRCRYLGAGSSPCAIPSVGAINAHATHFAQQTPSGELVTSTEVAAATAPSVPEAKRQAFARQVVFAIGCHAGLSVPDFARTSSDPDTHPDAGLSYDQKLDFPQAMATRAAYIASTSYGYGDDAGVGGTEQLLVLYAQELLHPTAPDGVTVGKALQAAKQRFVSTRSSMSVYDEKSSIALELYGLPMYKVVPNAAPPPPPLGPHFDTLNLTIVDGASSTVAHDIERIQLAGLGSYLAVDGLYVSTAGRPIQPQLSLPIAPNSVNPVHGVAMRAGKFKEIADFNPVITRPQALRSSSIKELSDCLDALWPSFTATGNDLGPSGAQTLIVVPGQFRCSSGQAGASVTGTERYFTDATYQLYRANSNDHTPPTLAAVDLRRLDASGNVGVTVKGSPDVAEIIVLRLAGGIATSVSQTFSGPGPYTMNLTGVTAETELVLQVRDAAFNFSYFTAKGANAKVIPVEAGSNPVYAPAVPLTFNATIGAFNLTGPVFYVWDFGDGQTASGIVTMTNSQGNIALPAVQHTYDAAAPQRIPASVKITDSNGGIGLDEVIVIRRCDASGDASSPNLPNADLIGCSTEKDATNVTFTLRVAGKITNDYAYRVDLDNGKLVKYQGGKVTGFKSATATISADGDDLMISVSLADLGLKAGDLLRWAAVTQAGVPGNQSGTGSIDRMPNAGSTEYRIP